MDPHFLLSIGVLCVMLHGIRMAMARADRGVTVTID